MTREKPSTPTPLPSSLSDAERWLRKHTNSAAAKALDKDERWAVRHRNWSRRRIDTVVFPWPEEVHDAAQAEDWARAVERLAADFNSNGDLAKWFFWLLLTLVMSGTVTSFFAEEWQAAALFISLGLVFWLFLMELGRGAYVLAPVWERRALAYRRRADQLAAPQQAAERLPVDESYGETAFDPPQELMPCKPDAVRINAPFNGRGAQRK